MITACLALMFVLAALRPNSLLKPSWMATFSGALSISTWGFLGISSGTLDAILGGANWITLVRDVLATFSFWFYREAVARATLRRPVGRPWLLITMVISFSVPFALIEDKGGTSGSFVLDRLDQPATWLFGCLYMSTLLFLSIDSIRLLRRNAFELTFRASRKLLGLIGIPLDRKDEKRRVICDRSLENPVPVLFVIAIGYVLVTAGCLIEVAYLTAAHLGYGGDAFRVSMYFAAEGPFFAGIFTIGGGIAWNALRTWLRFRWSIVELVSLRNRARMEQSLLNGLLIAFGRDPRRNAFRLFVELQNAVEIGAVNLTTAQSAQLKRIADRFSTKVDPVSDGKTWTAA